MHHKEGGHARLGKKCAVDDASLGHPPFSAIDGAKADAVAMCAYREKKCGGLVARKSGGF